jgi:hypothetical protein
MKELIYYPGFEINDSSWLKFALLYIDKLRPIIPASGDHVLSEWYRRLSGETDLLDFYRPEYNEGSVATIKAIETIDGFLSKPDRYTNLFGTDQLHIKWRDTNNQDYELFREKFSGDWIDFCLEEGIGNETDRGVKVTKHVAHLYMSILAHIVAHERDICPISDNRDIDNILMYLQRGDKKNEQQIAVAQNIIELKLPANLQEISMNEIISFRNKAGFKERLQAFHTELDKYSNGIERGGDATAFSKSFDYALKDFTIEIGSLGLATTGFGLSIWLSLTDPNTNVWDITEKISAIGELTSLLYIEQKWSATQSKRFCKKYMTDLTKIRARSM